MPKKRLKIFFVDFWKGFNPNKNFFIDKLGGIFDLELNPDPDYLIYSTFGSSHLKYTNSIKIYFTGENDVPDFNFCDYAIGFQHLSFEDRYLRLPLYLLYSEYETIKNKVITPDLAKRKFCNFVYSNSIYSTPLREQFFLLLSKYKKIDSGGRLLNNIGGAVQNKLDFIKDYKFTIAFENSSLSGYTTEKLMEPMTVNSLPIYWGNPSVQLDFNKASFICIQDYESMDMAIKEIIRLDKDDEAYLQKLSTPWLNKEQREIDWDQRISSFFDNIFNQPLEKAKRTTIYGYAIIKKYREAKFAKLASLPIIRKM
ncbi:glycosyltransferase family 10 domain-containing protein [Parabacteroides sp. Marseille-P3160]|uniref:glycosyltransferase family 10 domain-containing protein n=1 Tax=Parabacteroides sp. Marseille-P3160 TaxID=1917887 RepID=UPI0009B93794|nr:glycosyltransferase family 10 [Parabacteroides sp. Marseille-P3160]